MSEAQLRGAVGPIGARLLHPSTLLLLAANAMPLIGVLAWHWDAFVLLVLYWMETAVIGFWTIARIAASPPGTLGPLLIDGRPATNSSLAMAAFFIVHSGVFMGVHMVFLWAMFSGDWSRKIHDVRGFYDQIVVATGLWLPLLTLFVGRGVAFLFHVLKPDFIRRLERFMFGADPVPQAADDGGAIIGGFYARIVIMHVTILFGAFIAVAFGSLAPLIILIVLKTAVDLGLHLFVDLGQATKSPKPVPQPRPL